MRRPSLTFIVEQTLGHVAHTNNISRALQTMTDIESSVIRLPFTPPGRLRRLTGTGSWSLRASLMARSAISRQRGTGRLDALFIHTQVASLLSADLMRLIPTVISLDATPSNFDSLAAAYEHRRQGRLVEGAKTWINRRALAAAAGIVTWCYWAAESLVTEYGVPERKIRVIHPGVDLRLFAPRETPAGNRVRILFVGGDFERKGGPELIEAATAVGDLVELDIVSTSAPEGLGPHVRVHRGLKPQCPELVELYRRADIFALPTRGDCFPQVIAEALASGLPVIATNVGAMSEMVVDGGNGLLVPPMAPDRLAVALRALVMDPALRTRLGRASLDLGRAEHDADANNRSIVDLMCSLARGPETHRAIDETAAQAAVVE